MSRRTWSIQVPMLLGFLTAVLLMAASPLEAQPPGGPGGMGQTIKLIPQFDKDGDGRLDEEERKPAREFVKKERAKKPGGMRPGGPGGPGGRIEPGKPGPKVAPEDVKAFPKAGLYDPDVLRTLFIEFKDKEWEEELADFYHTDVEIPVTLAVDGKKYENVGVHFRGASSFFTVGAGSKRSLNISMDYANDKQRLYGYKTLNLLNSHGDPSYLNSVLYSHIARQYLPAPKANLVKVVINGESWGVFVNAQQFNKELLTEQFKTSKGGRWKVKGSPQGGGGLDYISDKPEDYKRRYELKSEENEKDWKALIELCRIVSKTPTEDLEKELKPILDIDSLLWFLALDVVLVNNDGYWVRASDYNIFRDAKGVFHIIPHDMNESFAMSAGFGGRPGGPGGPGGGRNSGIELDPLVGMNDAKKPLRSRLLAVPAYKTKYLEHVRTIADTWLDWKKLGPIVADHRKLLEKEIEADTRKLSSFDSFKRATADNSKDGNEKEATGLQSFAEKRRKFLLEHAEIKKLEINNKTDGK